MKYWNLRFNLAKVKTFSNLCVDNEFINYFINKITCRSIIYGKIDNLSFKNILAEVGEFCIDNIQTWTSSQLRLVSEETKLVLEKLLEKELKFLEVRYLDNRLYLLNILNSIEKVDLSNKDLEKPNIFRVEEKMGQKNISEVYVSENFKSIIESNNLQGFEFKEL